MLLENINSLHSVLLGLQNSNHVNVSEHKRRCGVCQNGSSTLQSRKCDCDAQNQADYLLKHEQDVHYLLFCHFALGGECLGQQASFAFRGGHLLFNIINQTECQFKFCLIDTSSLLRSQLANQYSNLLMKRGTTQTSNRKFKIKNTRRYEAKMIKVRTSLSATREAIEKELMKKKTISEQFFTYCLDQAQQIQNRLDPQGLFNKKCTYECRFCHKIFAKSTALGGHISKVHKESKFQQMIKQQPQMQVKLEQKSQIFYSDEENPHPLVKIEEKAEKYIEPHKIIKKKRGRKSKKMKELQLTRMIFKLEQREWKDIVKK